MQNHALKSSVVLNKSVLSYLSLVFFWVGYFDARYFFGSKISGSYLKPKICKVQYEARLEFQGGRDQTRKPSMGGVI